MVASPKRHFFSEYFCVECMYNAILLHNTHAHMTTPFHILILARTRAQAIDDHVPIESRVYTRSIDEVRLTFETWL